MHVLVEVTVADADFGRLSMEKDVHPRFACQLETRTWYITDDNGTVETVNGPGVVGMCSCPLLSVARHQLYLLLLLVYFLTNPFFRAHHMSGRVVSVR